MLNLKCSRENLPREKREEKFLKLDFNHHVPPLNQQEAKDESKRCLGNISCEACDLCRLVCPDLAITRDMVTGEIIIDLTYCKGCGICAWVCPKGAINMVLDQ